MSNIRRSFKRIYRRQKGITGLETAIILIAFVVVASVFAYTVLSAGLFSTQKSQEAIHSGLDETQSTLEIKGSTIGNGMGELVDCNAWVNGDPTNITTFQQDTTNYITAPGGIKIVDDQDRTTPVVIAYYVLDEPVTVSAGDAFKIWIHNYSGASLNLDASLELALDDDTGHTSVFGTWDETLAFDDDDFATTAEGYVTTLETTSLTSITAVGIVGKLDFATGDDLEMSFDDIRESVSGSPILSKCDSAWLDGTDVAQTGDVSTLIEASASVKLTTEDAIAADATIASIAVPSRDLSSNSLVKFWIRCSAAQDADELELVLDDDTAVTGPSVSIGALTADKWLKVEWDISGETDADIDAISGVTLQTSGTGAIATGVDIYLDIIETQPILSVTSTMNSYADQVQFTVANAIAGLGVDCTAPSDNGTNDANGLADGIIDSKDGTQTHRMVISYSDPFQEYTDLAWSVERIGKYDSDYLLEEGEQFLITVDLSYINNNAGQDDEKITKNNTFTLEVKPAIGATLTVERTMPAVVKGINNLW